MSHIRITSPRSAVNGYILKTRMIDKSGAVTECNRYFWAHEYEIVHVMTQQEKSSYEAALAGTKAPKKPKTSSWWR